LLYINNKCIDDTIYINITVQRILW